MQTLVLKLSITCALVHACAAPDNHTPILEHDDIHRSDDAHPGTPDSVSAHDTDEIDRADISDVAGSGDIPVSDSAQQPTDSGDIEAEDSTGGQPTEDTSQIAPPANDAWEPLRTYIDNKVALNNSTVLIGNASGTLFSYSRGDSTEETTYAIASASKWLMAITTLRVIDSEDISVMSMPSATLPYWTSEAADPRSSITLQQLLSFTSGFSGDSGLDPSTPALPCIEDKQASTQACTQSIYNETFAFPPAGSTFFYGPTHMYVAAAMVMTARNAPTWNTVFREELAAPLGIPLTSGFLAPSPKNGRPAGGALMSARDYALVLTALVAGELLSDESSALMTQDHTPSSTVTMMNVPTAATQDGTWHYGLGCWRECEGDDYDASECDAPGVISSPGAFGFYPWWDQKHGHWGVIAVQLNIPGAAAITSLIGQEIRQFVIPILGNQ